MHTQGYFLFLNPNILLVISHTLPASRPYRRCCLLQHLNVGARLDKQPYALGVAVGGGLVQRALTVLALRVDEGAELLISAQVREAIAAMFPAENLDAVVAATRPAPGFR